MAGEYFHVSNSSTSNKYAIQKINNCLDKIQELIDNYEPATTSQDFALLSTTIDITDSATTFFVSDLPMNEFPVYGNYGTTRIKIGKINNLGQFISNGVIGTFVVYQLYRKKSI